MKMISLTDLAMGPQVSRTCETFTPQSAGHLLIVGLYPTSPQQDAGILIEPTVSVPSENGAIPVATAPAEPELDPPAVRELSYGL